MSVDVIESIRARVNSFSGSYQEIASKAGVSYSWLSKFARGTRGKRAEFDVISRLQRALDELETARRAIEAMKPTPAEKHSNPHDLQQP